MALTRTATAQIIPLPQRRAPAPPPIDMPLPQPARVGPRVGVSLAASLALHGLLIWGVSISMVLPKMLKAPESSLEVVLVNSKSAQRPVQPKVLAQTNLTGGGNTDEPRRAKTPLPAQDRHKPALDDADLHRRMRDIEDRSQQLLTQLKSSAPPVVTAPEAPPEKTDAPPLPDIVERSLQMARLEAQISRRLEAFEQRPRREFVGAQAREFRFARYVDDWREKIERIGNFYYPEEARINKIHGSLRLTVAIRADGSVERVEIHRSSGHPALDDAALKIVQLASPFAKFPDDIRRDTGIIEITRTWTFTREAQLSSE